jgi:Mor family transcriptional regulator
MGYIKADEVLPEILLNQLQNYIDGRYIYIPRKEENKKSWGEITKSRLYTSQRNTEIYNRYKAGSTVKELAEKYYLSVKTIYKIIAAKN